jgi:hypothetical protein
VKRIGGILLLGMLLAGCSSTKRAEELGRQGMIDQTAPVKASLDITVNASPEKVWALLSDVKDWPTWQPAITDVSVAGPVASGTAFAWTLNGNAIHSTIEAAMPNAELAWTGKAFGATAIHVWKLKRLPGDQTQVHMEESMDGILVAMLFSSEKLRNGNQGWLDVLKIAAETRK